MEGEILKRNPFAKLKAPQQVDKSREVFVSQEVDLAIATLPQGLDPCDLLVQQGADAFRAVLDGAVNALDRVLLRLSRDRHEKSYLAKTLSAQRKQGALRLCEEEIIEGFGGIRGQRKNTMRG